MSGVVEVRGKCRTVSANFTRPDDTNAYAAGDVVADSTSAATVLTFAGAVRTGGSGLILTATAFSSQNAATKPDLQLFLFDTAPASYGNDNEAFVPTDAEMRALLQVISFPASAWVQGHRTAGANGNSFCNAQALWLPINVLVSDNAIYGVVVANAAYTPVATERFDFRLGILD